MQNTNHPNPLLSALFSKESLTFIKAKQLWDSKQWQVLTRSPFAATIVPHTEPMPPNPKVAQPKLSDDEPETDK